MSFYTKYELERLIADGEIKTFRAVENSSGRPVLVHMFNPEGQALLVALKARLAKDPRNPTPPLIELGDFAGNPYAVTEVLSPFKSLREWLGRADAPVAAPAPAAKPAPQEKAPQEKPPSEKSDTFEKLFGEPKPAPPAAASDVKPRTEGEFTKFFGQAPPPAPTPARPRAPQSSDDFSKLFGPMPDKAPPPKPDADEFTKMFGAPKPAATPPPSPAAAPPQTGQFTRLFGSGPSGEAINIEEEQARAAKSATPESRPFQAPTEFTRVFGPQQGGSLPQPPSRPLTIGSASGIFKAPGSPAPSAKPPVESSADAPPGEYTRMMGIPRERAAANPAQPRAPMPVVTPVPVPKRGMMIAISVGIAVLLLAIFAVVAMVLQKRP